MSGQTVLVCGGGHPQQVLVEALAALDVRVVVADDRPGVPAYGLADEVIPIGRYDYPRLLAWARANRPHRVASGGSDEAVFVAVRLAEALGLPSPISAATAEMPMRKARTRERLAAAGVPCPVTVKGDADTIRNVDWTAFRFPVVVKPDEGIGQTGVNRADDIAQAQASIEAALAATKNGVAIIQELADGEEIGINALVVASRVRLMTTSYRRSSRERGPRFGVAMEKVFPAVTDPDPLGALAGIVERACAAMGIENGPIYAQVIMDAAPGRDPRFTMIEIMPRLGGGEDPRLVRAATGFQLARATALMWLGRPIELAGLYDGPGHPAAVLRFLAADPGEIVDVSGVEAAREAPGVKAADVFYTAGYRLKALSSSRERAGYVLAVGSDPDGASRAAAAAAAMITIKTRG